VPLFCLHVCFRDLGLSLVNCSFLATFLVLGFFLPSNSTPSLLNKTARLVVERLLAAVLIIFGADRRLTNDTSDFPSFSGDRSLLLLSGRAHPAAAEGVEVVG